MVEAGRSRVFHRIELAERYASALVEGGPTSAMPSGLFLAAPRRTGKSTFLREDLVPALERRGVLVIYVDLWTERAMDPGLVIAGAIRAALVARAGDGTGLLERLGRRLGVESVSVAGVQISTTDSQADEALSFGAALEELSAHTGRMIALLVDEAQHANTSAAGANALFALKAARDELNRTEGNGLRIVATGSNRDKLAALVGSKAQAFYRAPLMDLPPLDEHYVRWFVDQQPFADDLDIEATTALFVRAGNQPELLGAAADRMRLEPPATDGPSATERLKSHLDAAIVADEAELLRTLGAVTPLARAVLVELARHPDGRFSPFGQPALNAYARALAAPDDTPVVPATSAVQRALAALQEASLVWKSQRGVYALEESRIVELLEREGWLA